ncbi:MAG: peptidylglycine alpha-amidating monooxygenase [Myxococcota bacterium]
MKWWWVACGLVVATACGSETTESGPSATEVAGGENEAELIPCAVEEVLERRCRQCHGSEPQFGAPMSLTTVSDLKATRGDRSTAEVALARMTGDRPMPPPPNPNATPEEVAALQAWVDAGFPSRPAGEQCAGGGGPGMLPTVDCEPDVSLRPAAPFEMPADEQDLQVCFGIDLPAGIDKRHITAIAPSIDNSRIIHHILLMQAPEAVSPEPEPCAFTNLDWKLLYAWGPGTPAQSLPEEAGFPMEAGQEQHFVLQVHYNNYQALEGEMDQSGIDLCTTDALRTFDADVMALGGVNFDAMTPMARSRLDCELELPSQIDPLLPVTVFQSWPHMHTLGRSLSGRVESSMGVVTPLVDLPNYDFELQLAYASEATIRPGDTIFTSCEWDNNTPMPVGFGEGTFDEMCFNFVSYYPRIDAPQWNWILPSALSACTMTVVD